MDTNSSVSKINKSRSILKKYLESEWDTSTIQDYSDNEIEKLYRISKLQNAGISFGHASGCNFSVYHKKIPMHQLHVIYYNFPEIGKPSIKVTKTCSDKIKGLYKDNIIQQEDSIIIILYDPVPENLEKSIEELYNKGQEEMKVVGLSEEIQNANTSLDDTQYTNQHFKNIHIFHLDTLSIDITLHRTVPKHECIRDQPSINEVLESCNARLNQLPAIMRTDAMAKRLRMAPGDICKITRNTQNGGEVVYYRVCK